MVSKGAKTLEKNYNYLNLIFDFAAKTLWKDRDNAHKQKSGSSVSINDKTETNLMEKRTFWNKNQYFAKTFCRCMENGLLRKTGVTWSTTGCFLWRKPRRRKQEVAGGGWRRSMFLWTNYLCVILIVFLTGTTQLKNCVLSSLVRRRKGFVNVLM